MLQPPRISVVMPSFNQAMYLEQAIRGVLAQRYPNLQFGVIDGGSTDGSLDILACYRRELDFVIVEPDRGQSEAINKGLRRADGEVVGWLCSDDLLLPGSLERIGRAFAQDPDRPWAAGGCVLIDAHGRPIGRQPVAGRFNLPGILLRRPGEFSLPQPGVYWRRSLMERAGLLDESLHYAMDFDLWCRFAALGARLHPIAHDLAAYRIHPASKTCSRQTGFIREHLLIERRMMRHLSRLDRWRLARRLGYVERSLWVMEGTPERWGRLSRRPWWLASQQVRAALRAA